MRPEIWIPATLLLVYRAHSRKSLTPAGIVAAALTAVVHGLHPWPLPFTLLVVFFLAGTRVTNIKKDKKAQLTLHSTGLSAHESPRTHIQVFANSACATILTAIHAYKLSRSSHSTECYPWGGDLLIVGIIANYAAVAADTFSSELGILSKSKPRLLTSWTLRQCPPGTNGGITPWGTLAGFGGSFILVTAAYATLPFCKPISERKGTLTSGGGPGWTVTEIRNFAILMVIWGGLGSLLDSLLGGWFQASVIDKHTGKIVEGNGGKTVLIGKDGAGSMHKNKRAELKSKILEGREGISAATTGAEIDNRLDADLGKDERYNAERKTKKSSFGNGEPSRVVENGAGLLDNNEVNFFMALSMTLGAMQVASKIWDVPMSSVWTI